MFWPHWSWGEYQLLLWPRWKVAFYRRRPLNGVYRWVVYCWPLELRRFDHPILLDQIARVVARHGDR